MTTSPFSLVHSVLDNGSIQVEIWAAAGSNLITADLGFSYSGAQFSSASGASGWSVQNNVSSSTTLSVAMFDGSFSNPVGDGSLERLITLLFMPLAGATQVDITITNAVASTTAADDQTLVAPPPLSVPLGASGTVSIAAASASKAEGNAGSTSYTFTATRTGDTSTTHTAAWAVSGTGANPATAADFVGGVLPSGTISFGAGETSKTITIQVAGDSAVEVDEGFMVTLSNPSAGLVLGTASATGTILNDDATVSIAAASASKAEGNAGSTSYTFTATRTGDTSTTHTAAWAVSGTGANPATAADFVGGVLPSGTVSFAAGETSQTITIQVAGDTTVEFDEEFSVNLLNLSNGLGVAASSSAGRIINDDSIFIFGQRQSGIIHGFNGNQFIFGSNSLDSVVFVSTRDNYIIDLGPNVITVTSKSTSEGTDTLVDIERLVFSDGILAFDISGNAGQAYRLYQAAFARTPDTAGLKYQTNALDTALTLSQVANNFIASPEFQGRYGSPSTVTDAQFVTLLYNNVLGRDPDQAGFDYHTTNLAAGLTRAQLLGQFSESPENQNNLLPVIGQGIWLG